MLMRFRVPRESVNVCVTIIFRRSPLHESKKQLRILELELLEATPISPFYQVVALRMVKTASSCSQQMSIKKKKLRATNMTVLS